MCLSWTWATAFNRGRHWSTAFLLMSCWSRLAQQVHTVPEIIQTHDSLHRTAGYSCQLFNISETFAGPMVVFLIAYQFSYTLDILFRSDSPRPSGTGVPRDPVRCVYLAQTISNRTDCPLLVRKLFTNTFGTPSLFWRRSLIDHLSSFVKGMFINKLWRNNDVTLMMLHCVSCRVGSLHLLGSSFGTLENICTKFTYISQKWFYFSVHNNTLYLHISLGRRKWLRCRGAVFYGPPWQCMTTC